MLCYQELFTVLLQVYLYLHLVVEYGEHMENQTARKVIAIGFEALEPELLEKWCAEGKLPNFQKIMKEGSYRKMLSTAEISSGSTWSTINCGVTPGKHGMGFCHREFKSGTYEVRKKRADEVGRLPFWKILSDAGKKVLTLDVPETRVYGPEWP